MRRDRAIPTFPPAGTAALALARRCISRWERPETAEVLRFTEGELKADVICALDDLPTVGAPGVGNWRCAFAEMKALGVKTGRLAFDADSCENPVVARVLASCAEAIVKAGYAVELERWDLADGKGLDDLLAAGKKPEVLCGEAALDAIREMVAPASAGEESAAADELARLHEVLDRDGEEGLYRDKALMQALATLSVTDAAAFAAIRAAIRGRISVRDFDRALRQYVPKPSTNFAAERMNYFEGGGRTFHKVLNKDGETVVPLCNFTARIKEDVVHDDGAEQTRLLAVEGELADGRPLPRVEIPADQFAAMNWVMSAWGTQAVVYAGPGTRDHLRTALQLLSDDVPRSTIYGHLGWREIGGEWVYLHAGGAIGKDGPVSGVRVMHPGSLFGFRFDVIPEGPELVEAISASLEFLLLGPERITFPLLAAPYRVVLGDTDFSLHLAGPTGSYKTEAAALVQQHFGPGLDARNLPASWSSTGNALEGLAFVCKDALLVVDDFCPIGSTAEVLRYNREADRLLRGQGNRSGRQRMRSDGTLRPQKPPRGLILSTGEDIPRGQSIRARVLALEVGKGDFGPAPEDGSNERLSACQRDAAAGKYAASMAGFIRWLARRYAAVRAGLKAKVAQLRETFRASQQHARTPGIVADLAIGLRYFLDFSLEVGAIDEAERAKYWEYGQAALKGAAADQSEHLAVAEPAGHFARLLAAALAGGYAHVVDQCGNAPDQPERWGWHAEELRASDGSRETRLKPQGKCVGWIVGENLYLQPETSYAVVQSLARDQGESLAVSPTTLRLRMKEKGYLASTDKKRGKLPVRRTLQGCRREVLHFLLSMLEPCQEETGPTGPEGSGGAANGPINGAGARADNNQLNQKPAH